MHVFVANATSATPVVTFQNFTERPKLNLACVPSDFNEISGKMMDPNFDLPGWASAIDQRTGRQ